MTVYDALEQYLSAKQAQGELTYEMDAPLSRYSTFKIGGVCDVVVHPTSAQTLCELLDTLENNGIRALVFGNASNVLFCDEGIHGCVIFTTKIRDISHENGVIKASCGVTLTELSRYAQKCGYKGMEFLCGIPGNVGGGVFMNAGAYEHNISDMLIESEYYDRTERTVKTLSASEHEFTYRHSVYQQNTDRVILSAKFKPDIADDPEAVRRLMEDHLTTRSRNQPLEYPSAGSVFKRCEGKFTSRMIDQAGLKGLTVGGAQVSEKHAGFIVNKGGATAADVLGLVELVKEEICKKYGVSIECEIRYVK